ncbi:MAG: GNAT family N-acetyltransferase [Bacteroidetes bacterium]|nr:MAG: GNAT family N-acetyltransferase [Bacteroidota bacterium]
MVTIRQAEEKDYPRINDFHNRYYGKNRTLEQFYWGFHNCPAGPSIYFIAEDGDRVICTNCIIPIEVIDSDGKTWLTGKSEDTLLDPDYWGQPIFYNLYKQMLERAAEKGITAVWGFTPARKPFKKLGFELPYPHSQSLMVNQLLPSYRFLKSLNPENKALDKLKIMGLCFLSKATSALHGTAKLPKNYTVARDENTAGADLLMKANLEKNPEKFSIYHSEAYQKWRIYNNPNLYKTHTFSFYDSTGSQKGYMVFNVHPDGVAYVSQSVFHPELPPEDMAGMIGYASRQLFSKEGVAMVRNWHFSHNSYNRVETRYFQQAGYTFLNRGIDFVWKELLPIPLKPENFILSRMATQGII